jgi:soluble lytic murein transglycosylase
MRFLQLLLFCLIAINCTSTSKEQSYFPPKKELNTFNFGGVLSVSKNQKQKLVDHFRQASADTQSIENQWWGKYHLAQMLKAERSEESCHLFLELTQDTRFPAHFVAELRGIETCPATKEALDKIWADHEDGKNRWLNELRIKTGLLKAKQVGNEESLARFLYANSFYVKTEREKIDSLNQSLDLAKKTVQTELIEKIEARIFKVAPRLVKDQTKKPDSFDLASDYRRARKFDEALNQYKKITTEKNRSHNDVYRAFQGIRTTYKLMLNTEGAVNATKELEAHLHKKLVSFKKPNSELIALYLKAAILLTRTLWTEDQTSLAIQTLDRAEKALNGKTRLDEVHWLSARIKEERGEFAAAIESGKKALSQASVGSEVWLKIKWLIAWNLRKVGDFKNSLVQLNELYEKTESTSLKAKYKYWAARAQEDLGEKENAKVSFESLLIDDPLGYYGVLAYRALDKEIPPLLDETDLLVRSPAAIGGSKPESVPPEYNLADWLLSLNETDLAKEFLSTKTFDLESASIDANKEKLVHLIAQSGDYNRVFAYLASAEPDFRNKVVLDKPRLLFPRPHFDVVNEASKKYGVMPELVYSIMRQESAFNRFARSHADAFGLMQLLPSVAKREAQGTGISVNDPEDLYNPEVAIPLGTKHLRTLLGRFKNQFILTVASYNASERAVMGWVKTRYRNDPTEFIEDIPYEETQLYIKLILRNLVFYQRLLSPKSVKFPEWCLSGLQSFKS